MPELLSIDNFKGMVSDAADGKQPKDTCKTIKNMMYDREYGSLVSRFTYNNSIAKPTGVSTLSSWLSFPVTYPSATDHHLWFTEDGIYQYNYWHNSSTLTNGWVLVTESKDLSSIASGDVTVNASPTNTIVIANADTTWGLSTTNDYYKNWVFQGIGGNTATYFVKSYSFAGHTATFTLDNVLTINWAVIPDYKLFRYFHKDYTFTPSFTYPAGYSTETAMRWSGGGGSTTGLKNLKSGYLNKIFFAGTSGVTHTFTGTYIDQAECSAPSSSILTGSSFTETYASDKIIKLSKDYDFDNTSSTDWTGTTEFGATVGSSTITALFNDVFGGFTAVEIPINGLLIKSTNGAEGSYSANYVELPSNGTYLESITSGSSYTLKVKGFSADANGKTAKLKIRVSKSDDTLNYDSGEIILKPDNTLDQSGVTSGVISSGEFTFTAGFTGVPKIRMYLVDIPFGASYSAIITSISLSLTANYTLSLDYGYTYKLWASYVYDKTQESELTYLASDYITGKNSKLAYEINQKLGALSKFVSGIRLYLSKEAGDTTGTTSSTIAPRYLMNTIWIDNDASATWTFDTSAGRYEYASSFSGGDWQNKGLTWEQKTQRTASASTTCSYYLAKQASGRIFLADDYDYADGRLYVNRVRYTGFNGDGAPTPDIFPNIQDVFITTVTVGQSQEIRNIAEFDGDLIILKKSSVVRLNASNPDTFTWTLRLIKNGVGTRSSKAAYKFDKGLFFTDLYSAYLYDGYQVRDVLKGIYRNAYQVAVSSDAVAITSIVWYNPINDTIAFVPNTAFGANYYEFNTSSWIPVGNENGTGYEIQTLVTTSDGVIHFSPNTVGSTAYKISSQYESPLINIIVDTGYYGMPNSKLAQPKWVCVLAQLPETSTMTVSIYGQDTALLGRGVFTSTTDEMRLYKFQLITDSNNRMLDVLVTQNGTVAPELQPFKIHKIYVEGNLVDEYTDITETVTVT